MVSTWNSAVVLLRGYQRGGNGNSGSFDSIKSIDVPGPLYALSTADVNGNGQVDIVGVTFPVGSNFNSVVLLADYDPAANAFGSAVAWGNRENGFDYPFAYVAPGDFDGDGLDDIAVSDGSRVIVLFFNHNGLAEPATYNFQAGTFFPTGSGADATAGDVDGDGVADLVLSNDAQLAILRGGHDRAEMFSSQQYLATASGGQLVRLADLDGDGDLDIIATSTGTLIPVGHPDSPDYYIYGEDGGVSVHFNRGNGTFPQGFIHYEGGSQFYALAVGDLNGDGLDDVAAGRYFAGEISIWQNWMPRAGGPYAIHEGQDLTLIAQDLASIGGVPVNYVWDINGDGDFSDAAGKSTTLTWAQLEQLGITDGPALFRVQVRAVAGDRWITSSPVTLTVTNSPPTVNLTASAMGLRGSITLSGQDASAADAASGFAFVVDWGDGTTQTTSAASLTHTYVATSSYTIHARAKTLADTVLGTEATQALAIVVDATSINTDLQTAVNQVFNPSGSPSGEVELAVAPSALSSVLAAVEGLSVGSTPAQANVEIQLDLGSGSYSGQQVSVPNNVTLRITSSAGQTVFVGASPALSVHSGTVIVEGITFINGTDAPTIRVTGGSLTVRNSTVQETTGGNQAALEITGGSVDLGTAADPGHNILNINGPGQLIRNTGSATVWALGNTLENNGAVLSPYRVEDAIFHALDAGGGGLVVYVADNVYVTAQSGSIQRGVSAVTVGGTVNVETGSYADYTVGSKLLTISFEGGPRLTQQPDALNSSKRMLVVTGTAGNDKILFTPGAGGAIVAAINGLPTGAFAVTGRLVAYGLAGDDDIEAAGNIVLPAWFYGGTGDDRLKGGAGHDVLLGQDGDDLLVGGGGRDLIIGGRGADRIVGNADDDILIAGSTAFDGNEVALTAIMAEWTSSRSYAQRTMNLLGDGSSASYTARANGNIFLKTGDETVPASQAAATVFDDGAADVVTGSEGQDWFFANVAGSGVKDKITDLSAAEFAGDLDFILTP